MRIFFAFLIVLVSAILFMLPVTQGVYDFQTDYRTDEFTVTTGIGTTNTSVTLFKSIYDDDVSTIDLLSASSLDTPLFSSYNTTTRALVITDLSDNLSRTLNVSYDVDALTGSDAISNVISKIPLIWMLCIIALPIAGIAAIFMGRI